MSNAPYRTSGKSEARRRTLVPAFSIYLFIALVCYIARIFHVLTHFRDATYYVPDFSDEE